MLSLGQETRYARDARSQVDHSLDRSGKDGYIRFLESSCVSRGEACLMLGECCFQRRFTPHADRSINRSEKADE